MLAESSPSMLPIACAYATALLGLQLAPRLAPHTWPGAATPRGPRPGVDLAVALAAVAAVLALGQLWHGGLLRWNWPGPWRHLGYVLAQLLIWSPLAAALWLRGHGPATCWCAGVGLPLRLAVGAGLAVVAVAVHTVLAGEPAFATVLSRALTANAFAHAVPVFLEGVGLAFLFVRLAWCAGHGVAAAVPAALFAAAHVPRGLAEGHDAFTIVGMFAFNLLLVGGMLLLVARCRDVVALGVVHWLMDVAIAAF